MTVYTTQAVICFIIFVLGVIGNSIVLYVLIRQRGTWSITTTYLFNLAIADILFVCFLPFWGHYHLSELEWQFGTPLCKAAGTMTFLNMYASIFFLTAMSADRWTAIVHATRMNLRRNVKVTRWLCVAIWAVSLLLCLPSIIFRTVKKSAESDCDADLGNSSSNGTDPSAHLDRCMLFIPDVKSKTSIMGTLEFVQSIIGFILPLGTICFCYINIVLTVRRKVISRRVQKDRVAKLAGFVIGAFIFCWTPYHIVNLYSALGGWWQLFEADGCFYKNVKPFVVCLAYANSCINPIVYAFTTTNFQENMRDICTSDKSPRPYRMVLSNPNDEKVGRTQLLQLNTIKSTSSKTPKPADEAEILRAKVSWTFLGSIHSASNRVTGKSGKEQIRYNSKLKNSDYEKLSTYLKLPVKTFVKILQDIVFFIKRIVSCFAIALNTILKYKI